mgnify:CR=1 FL=1
MILVYATFRSETEVKKAAKLLVADKLVACVNFFPAGTTYFWNELREGTEWVGIFKTRESLVEKVFSIIKKNNTYETPAIFTIPVGAVDQDYEKWVEEVTQ